MIVIICIVYSILSMTLLIYRLISYPQRLLKNAFLRLWTKLVYFWWHSLFINVFKIWATFVITGWRFMLFVVWYQFSRRLTFTTVSLRSWSSLRKPIFAFLPVLLVVSSLIHLDHNVISSWIHGRFTGLIMSIFNESLLDVCLHTIAQKRVVYVILCTFSKSYMYYELILIYNFEQKYYTTSSVGAKLFVYSIHCRKTLGNIVTFKIKSRYIFKWKLNFIIFLVFDWIFIRCRICAYS